jgi:hypothetical protein
MAVMAILEDDASPEDYREVSGRLDVETNPPAGLILHAVSALDGNRLRIVDIWESAEAARDFYQGRLRQALADVLGPDAPEGFPSEMREISVLIQP